MLGKENTILKYGISLLIGFVSFIVLFFLSATMLEKKLPSSIKLSEGWKVAVNGRDYSKPKLADVNFPSVGTGDVVTLTCSLPTFALVNPVLRINAWYCIVDVSINGIQVYSYGHEIASSGKNVGCGFHIVPINNLPNNSVLRISLIVCEPDSFSTIFPIYVESAEHTFAGLVRGNILLNFASLFFISWGIIGIFHSIIMLFFKRKEKKIFVCAFFLLSLGLESLYHNGCIKAFFTNFTFNSWFEHISIFMLNISMMLFFITLVPIHRFIKFIFQVLLGWFLLYVFVAIILDFTNIVHLPGTRNVLFISLAVEIIIAIIGIVECVLNHKNEEKLNAIGFISMLVAAIVEFLVYYILKNFNSQFSIFAGSGMIVGTTLMLLCILLSFILKIKPRVQQEENKRLYNLSLKTDYLTNLPNEIAFEESLEIFEEKFNNSYYAIVLNIEPLGSDVPCIGTFEGDAVLLKFIELVKNIFSQNGKIFRMANQSLCVLYNAENDEIVKSNLKKLDDMLDEENQHHPRMRYFMLAGFARRSGTSRANTIYQLAQSHISKDR